MEGIRNRSFGGAAAIAGGGCWVAKGAAIIATGDQPPMLFEVAPLLLAAGVLAFARQLPPSRARRVATATAGAACVAGAVVAVHGVRPLPDAVAGVATALATLLLLTALGVAGARLRRRPEGRGAALPFALAVATVPAIVAGGALAALLGDRALEVPVVALGACWIVFGAQLARGRLGGELYAARSP